jgi:hypothetical protein
MRFTAKTLRREVAQGNATFLEIDCRVKELLGLHNAESAGMKAKA